MGVIVPTSMDNVEHNGAPIIRFLSFEILAVILQLLSIVFNGAIICTLCRRSLLKYPSNRFVFSLCLSHLVVSFLSVSISLVTAFIPTSLSRLHHELDSSNVRTQQHHESFTGNGIAKSLGIPPISHPCADGGRGVDLAHLIMMHLNFGVAVCTSITVALISAERYITIARPMRYKSIVTARRSLYAIICCWLLVALITMMPLVFFENRSPLCGTFSVPMESLAKYFGVVFAVVTIFALAVMIVCYTHIFRIAKAKCQKVQIGHFTASTVSSISSDWPSSAYSSVQGQNRFLHSGSRIESSNSLLHWVLMTNLGKHALPLRVPSALRGGIPVTPPGTPTLPPKNAFFSESALNNRRESDTTTAVSGTGTIRNESASSPHSSHAGGGYIDPSCPIFQQYHHLSGGQKLRNKWKTYFRFQANSHSPVKTIITIVLIISTVCFTQLPLSFVLFTSTVETTQSWFQFCTTVLFSTSSVANPILYGFLNRSIRQQLWRLLRNSRGNSEHVPSASSIRKRKRGQHRQQLEEMTNNARGFLSSANHRHLQSLCRGGIEIPTIKISRKESISSDDNSSVHSITSTNSINTIGSSSTLTINGGFQGAKGKITQVQNRGAASPYYRSVLLKKAYANSSNSLLPRLTLPDMSIRRNSSGSIASSSGTNMNGVISKKKGKVNDGDMKLSAPTDEYDTRMQDNQTEGQTEPRQSLEMQTFRNYSTPDLSSPSTSTKSEPHQSPATPTQLQETTEDSFLQTESTEIKCNGQLEKELKKPCLSVERLSPTDESFSRECDSDIAFPSAVNKLGQPSSSQSVIPEASQNTSCNYKGNDSSKPMGVGIDDDMLPDNFPRKPSQDSGADMAFSDEEDELSPPTTCHLVDSCGHARHFDHTSPPLLFPTASMHSLPAVLRTLKPLEGDNDKMTGTTSASCVSLMGPFVLIKHSDDAESTSADVLLLPCPCSRNDNSSLENRNYDEEENGRANKIENNVTVTITDSNSDTQLFNPDIFNSNESLLQVHQNAHNRNYFIRLQCIERDCKAHHKSKSESDICGMEKRRQSSHYDDTNDNEMKVRSNCYINLVDPSSNGKSDVHNNAMDSAGRFKVYASCCERCCNAENRKNRGCSGISRSSCSLRVNQEHVRVMPTSYSSEQICHHLLNANLSNKSSPSGSVVCQLSHSPQWLSVMSVHSSCSSLSSTCPLRILDGHNKSDASDYDDFEDHIEI